MARQTNRDIFRTIEKRIQKSQRKYERQGFTVNLPHWFIELQQRATEKGKRFTKRMLGEAEKLAKNFKKTTVPKAERQAEKQRKKEEREAQKQYFKDYWNKFYDEDDELFHPQYEDEDDTEELPDETSAVLQEVITLLEDALANGVNSADEVLLALQTAIDTEGTRKVAKGIASVGDKLKEAIRQMRYWSEKVNPEYESDWAGESIRLIEQSINRVSDLAGSGSNGYGL